MVVAQDRRLLLPRADGTLVHYIPGPPSPYGTPDGVSPRLRTRVAYAAAHVVADPLADINPTLETTLGRCGAAALPRGRHEERHR